ncbi:hypothetical protein CYMTET_5789 [Cymbomonas tetramitiformis]|uniref:Glutamate/phenylalanine/leucine/valine/L-tryptophan dehydrogenase C-terminal domain-containing protein n=1 Tax=Cymbomonas tetramitiformis TaxID=36881 RepID=A0AAE0GYR0_9CHLO|nr:hypothetical protein CYMTET_5789 [Cymbomonas tetramitiformis]
MSRLSSSGRAVANLYYLSRRISSRSYWATSDSSAVGSKFTTATRTFSAEMPKWNSADDQRQLAMIYSLERQQRATAEQVVPWFLDNMPKEYFDRVPAALQERHLHAIASLNMTGAVPEMTIITEDEVSVILPYDRPGLLTTLLESLQQHPNIGSTKRVSSIDCFSTRDGRLHIDVISFSKSDTSIRGKAENLNQSTECFQDIYNAVKGTDGVAVKNVDSWTEDNGTRHVRFQVGAANVFPRLALQRVSQYFGLLGANIKKVNCTTQQDSSNVLGTGNLPAEVTLIEMEVELNPESARSLEDLEVYEAELKRATKWMDDSVLEFAMSHPDIPISTVEVMMMLCKLQHARLALNDPYAFTLSAIDQYIRQEQQLPHLTAIAELFLDRFNPANPLSCADFQARAAQLRQNFNKGVSDEKALQFMESSLEAVEATLRTNFYLPDRYAIALRLHPSFTGHGTVGTDLPHGVFFISGRRFKAFHVRFRDTARGGLRVVCPRTKEAHAVESGRIFNEAYSLAFAQQLKNKDIPEGGSKAVLLMEPNKQDGFNPDKFGSHFMVRKCVRAFTDALLDLTSKHDEWHNVVDHLGSQELLFLGPDENILPEDIEWIINRASQRNYFNPQALMSSKPTNGINHKEYGVTSEGVAVFLDVALRRLKLHPDTTNRPVRIKLTGGTDGDVAGNMLRILHRDYGSAVHVVGISDGTGCVEDPSGICAEELMRLVELSLPLKDFDASRLGPEGVLTLANTVEGVHIRDTMHNRVQADAFVPAGGRPATMHAGNWRDYLSGPDGAPSSPLIVEGANLFLTPEARQSLFDDAAVVVVKDSSANKCGVITSSYEVLAAMMVPKDAFLEHKVSIVEDVLSQLRRLAAVEAKLLFNEFEKDPRLSIPAQSTRASEAITRIHDAVVSELQNIVPDANGELDWETPVCMNRHGEGRLTLAEAVTLLTREHIPAALQDCAEKFNEHDDKPLLACLPWPYLQNIIACKLATKLVYYEGLTYVESLPPNDTKLLAATAFRYLTEEEKVKRLMQQIEESSDLSSQDELLQFVKKAGVRAALNMQNV